ncbi:MAG: hypothetical protein SXU28_10425 [Pseudomonadota bacterium]|nr:hypothetical protein [Pseudomonadota bacterium]
MNEPLRLVVLMALKFTQVFCLCVTGAYGAKWATDTFQGAAYLAMLTLILATIVFTWLWSSRQIRQYADSEEPANQERA